jgi:hypothetical protein
MCPGLAGVLGGPGDPHGSNNPLDYLNPFGHTSEGGSNTGAPTQRNVGRVVGTLSNFFIPGSGFITGPLARWATNLIQHGWTREQAQDAVRKVQQAPSTAAPVAAPPVLGPGSAFSPTGQTAVGREWWSGDFGRGLPSGEAGEGPGIASVEFGGSGGHSVL